MMLLRSVNLQRAADRQREGFPFNLPLLANLFELHFHSPVTIFVGENGTGKSTLLEALAAAVNSITIGQESIATDKTLEHARRLAKSLQLVWQVKTRRGFFLRSEDFFSYAKYLAEIKVEMEDGLKEMDEKLKGHSDYARTLARMPFRGSLAKLQQDYGEGLDSRSHGESFLALFQSRLAPGGLYLLDEPEVALSPTRQLAFITMIKEAVQQGSQFIIATHSPILMACPEAEILSFDEVPVRCVAYEDLEHVKITKAFLNNPESFLRHL